jgi:hypothetical protein
MTCSYHYNKFVQKIRRVLYRQSPEGSAARNIAAAVAEAAQQRATVEASTPPPSRRAARAERLQAHGSTAHRIDMGRRQPTQEQRNRTTAEIEIVKRQIAELNIERTKKKKKETGLSDIEKAQRTRDIKNRSQEEVEALSSWRDSEPVLRHGDEVRVEDPLDLQRGMSTARLSRQGQRDARREARQNPQRQETQPQPPKRKIEVTSARIEQPSLLQKGRALLGRLFGRRKK